MSIVTDLYRLQSLFAKAKPKLELYLDVNYLLITFISNKKFVNMMVFSYEKQDDATYYMAYRVSYWIVVIVGALGLVALLFVGGFSIPSTSLSTLVDNLLTVLVTLVALSVAALLVGWIQVAFTSKLGEEVILLVMWLTPFLVMAASAYLYVNTNDTNMLGGLAAGIIFLGFVFYFRKQVRLSARLIEVGAEITMKNMSLMAPQLGAFISTTIITMLMLPGEVFVFVFFANINVILAVFMAALYMFMYAFVIAAIRAFADASNLSYINQWYSGSKPSNSKAKEEISNLKAPIVKYAFLMAFISRFRTKKRSGFSPFSLFKFMDFRNWPNLLFARRSAVSTAADVAAYFGNYTLIIIVTKKTRSIFQAYKESAKATWKSFAANIAGSMGFNILETIRQWLSAILLLSLGGLYGYSVYGDVIIAIIMAILFLILGSTPLNSMFKPVVNGYRLLLYQSYFGKSSSMLDKKTKEIISAAVKK